MAENLTTIARPPAGNPALKMIGRFIGPPNLQEHCLLEILGLPNFKFKLPSRNWLMFWTVTGSFTTALLYDRYHKRRALRRWCTLVSHVGQEPLPVNMMPRRITIFLSAPPGDSIRVARDHFHEYVKPVLVAGAVDWDVVEGRREGEVRAGLAKKIRKLRKRKGEISQGEGGEESQEDLFEEMRKRVGTREWNGVQGDLVLGRHTWKEYVRGLHEGWLGPLDESQPLDPSATDPPLLGTSIPANPETELPSSNPLNDSSLQRDSPTPEKSQGKPEKPSPVPPYITPADYPSSPIAPSIPAFLPSSLPLPLPHLLGFVHTPTRVYRFLTQRHLADSTGRSVAALVLAAQSRPYTRSTKFASLKDPDDASPNTDTLAESGVTQVKETWEQEIVLKGQEQEWHKSAWKANDEGDMRERIWQEPMVVDDRIGQRMREFELESGQEEKAVKLDEERRKEEPTYIQKAKILVGWGHQEKRGWEMGLEGNESE